METLSTKLMPTRGWVSSPVGQVGPRWRKAVLGGSKFPSELLMSTGTPHGQPGGEGHWQRRPGGCSFDIHISLGVLHRKEHKSRASSLPGLSPSWHRREAHSARQHLLTRSWGWGLPLEGSKTTIWDKSERKRLGSHEWNVSLSHFSSTACFGWKTAP